MTKRPVQDGVNWDIVGREGFDKTVGALLHRVHADANDVCSPDDSGGDGGRDVVVEYPGKRIIYQLKFFPDGLVSKPDSRKKQIKHSFASALKHQPDEWVLVFPSKMNDAMRTFLLGLGRGNSVKIRWLDRPRLDGLLAEHRDLLHLLEKDDYLLRQVAAYGQEKAVLAGGTSDLLSRIGGLQSVIDDQHPDWSLDFARHGNTTILIPLAKHPRAHETSPIAFDFVFGFSESDEDLHTAIRKNIGFGGATGVVVPSANIRKFEWRGPDFMRPTGQLSELHVGGTPSSPSILGKALDLRILGLEGQLLAEREGVVTHGASGAAGHSLEVEFHRGVTVTFYLPNREGDAGSIDLRVHMDGLEASPTHRTATFVLALQQAATLDLRIDKMKLAVLALAASSTADEDMYGQNMSALAEAAEDLDRIQTATGSYFAAPGDISGNDRMWLRAARIILDGGIAAIPRSSFSGTALAGLDINSVLGGADEGAFCFLQRDRPVSLLGHDLHFPPMWVFHPHANFEGVRESAEDATNGVEAPRKFTVRPANGQPFVAYCPELVKDYSEGVTPWNLTGVDEPPRTEIRAPGHPRESGRKG